MNQGRRRIIAIAATVGIMIWTAPSAHAACTGGPEIFVCASEADYLAKIGELGYSTFVEGFEDATDWGTVRSTLTVINSAAAITTSQGITWTANHAQNEITTGVARRTGQWGLYDPDHGYATGSTAQCDIDNPPEHCLWYDGFTGTRVFGTGALYAAGGHIRTSTVGANLVMVIDDDDINRIDFGKLADTAYHFFGVIDTRGFNRFQFKEIDGKIGQKFLIFGDDFVMAHRRDYVGVRRGARFLLDVNGNGYWDGTAGGDVDVGFGMAADIPLTGDWNGDGADDIGVWRNGRFYIDLNGNDRWDGIAGGDYVFAFGLTTDRPVIGDWNGDGFDDVGVRRGARFLLDANGNDQWDGTAGGDGTVSFGVPTDRPVIGDWNGDGVDDLGVSRANRFLLDANGNDLWDGTAGGDALFSFGVATDLPVIGDWNADNRDDVGVRRGDRFLLDGNGTQVWEGLSGGDLSITFGLSTDIPIIGKW